MIAKVSVFFVTVLAAFLYSNVNAGDTAVLGVGHFRVAKCATSPPLSDAGGPVRICTASNGELTISEGGLAYFDLLTTNQTILDSQVTDALTISGGTINNTPIGAITPSTGVFTTLRTGDIEMECKDGSCLWTVYETKDGLFLLNRLTGNKFKFVLERVD